MTVDINFVAQSYTPQECPLQFDNTSCEGIFKLAQRVMVLMFETPDTALAYSGSDILDRFGKGSNYDAGDVNNIISLALSQVKSAIQEYDGDAALPEDEKLLDLKLRENATVSGDSLIFTVQITSVSGQTLLTSIPYTLSGGE